VLELFTWFRQSAFRLADGERTVYIDPWGTPEDAPVADLILITHAHFDHFQPEEIARLSTSDTVVAAPHDVAAALTGNVIPVAPGESRQLAGVPFTTVPAYNTREEALDFHPKANRWVGYVIEFGESTVYHAGDTDHAPELDEVRADVALVPIGGYYTMDATEAGGLVKVIEPSVAVPMHFGFVVGSPSEADVFRRAAAPVAVEVLVPQDPYEQA
jgi:L-ascorbate metabolism protein UlaG (beta-lactamase superfamily)